MYDSWRSTDPAGPAAGPGTVASMPPTGQHPQLISSAWRIRNLSDIQTTAANGSSAILEPEVAIAQDNSTNEGQENDKMAPVVANSELVNEEEDCEKMLNSSFSASFPSPSPSSSSLPQPCDDQNRQDFFPQSIESMSSTPTARSSQLLDSISDLRLVDETEAAVRQRRPSDGALPVSTGSCGISYTNGHVVTGSEVSDEKAGYMNLRHKSRRKPVQDRPRPKRQAARDMCRPLKQWLYCHRDTPYPTKAEKQDLALLSRMTLTQVSNWFANARRRLKNTVSGGQEVTWRRRIKLYNQFVVGNQELLSISSDDTMWDEDDDDDDEEEERREWEEGRMEGRGKDNVLNNSPLCPLPRLTTVTSSSLLSSSSLDASGRRHRLPLLTFDPEVVDLSSPATASSSGACCTPAAKFKQGILQRYLTDAYERVGQNGVKEGEEEGYEETEGDGGAMEETEASRHGHRRHRNGSGSLSSHDYEEEMSLSARSTPTKEHQTNEEEDDIAEDRGHSNTPSKFGSSNDPDDLYWMEISAALALTNLAMRSRLNSGSSHESSQRV